MLTKVVLVVGARPNFMKVAPIMRAMNDYNDKNGATFDSYLVHTGQHYDNCMSECFFDELGIPKSDINLGVGSGSHAGQTAAVIVKIEKVFLEQDPKLVIVVGDVNSTLAAAITAAKLKIPIAHVEAGLRSFDREMPEEINRIVTDAISDVLFVTEEDGRVNLWSEGYSSEKIFMVGDVMIDNLHDRMEAIDASDVVERTGLESNGYVVATLHRQGNVDSAVTLDGILGAFKDIAACIPLVFVRHPRTAKRMEEFGLDGGGLEIVPPLGYVDFMGLVKGSKFVMTDSGGLQAEATALKKRCLTISFTTEHQSTIAFGSNLLVGTDPDNIRMEAFDVIDGAETDVQVPLLYDGHAAERIVNILAERINGA